MIRSIDDQRRLAEAFLDATRARGEVDHPDREVADLRQLFRAAFALLTPNQLDRFCWDLREVDALFRDAPEYRDVARLARREFFPPAAL